MHIIEILIGSLLITLLTYFLTKKVLAFTSKQVITPLRCFLSSAMAIFLYSYFSGRLDMLLYYIPYLTFWFLLDTRRSNKK